ncbi:MAG: hypothetical protein ACRD2R_02475 [Terriglobales bacterium]
MRAFLDTVAWLLVSWYATIPCFWLAIHPFIGFWRGRRGSPYKIILPLWLAMIAVAATATWPWRHARLYDTPFSWAAAVVLFATAVSVYHRSRGSMSSAQVMGRRRSSRKSTSRSSPPPACASASAIRSISGTC